MAHSPVDVGEREQENNTAVAKEHQTRSSDFIQEARSEAGATELETPYINMVNVGKGERQGERERLRVTVEITHPALSLPIYLTWTGKQHKLLLSL